MTDDPYAPYLGRDREDLLAEYITRYIERFGRWPEGAEESPGGQLLSDLAELDRHARAPRQRFSTDDGMGNA